MKTGNIPEKLTIFIRPETSVYWRWDDVEEKDKAIETKVLPCYISDSTNKKTLESGASWADQSTYDRVTQKYTKEGFDKIEVDNKPFTNLRIITLEIRDQGGRAYKICADIGDKKNLYFDMREDVLLDSMFNVGIKVGGIVPGKFIFARVGSQMKPIRVGSLLHDKMIEATKYNAKAACDLEIGGKYSNKKGEIAIFLGKYWTFDPKFEFDETNNRYGHYINDDSRKPVVAVDIGKPIEVYVFHTFYGIKYMDEPFYIEREKENHDMWYYLKDEKGNYADSPPRHKKGEPTAYTLHTVKSHSYKECLGVVPIPAGGYVDDVIKNIIEDDANRDYNQKSTYPDYALKEYSKVINLSNTKGQIHPWMLHQNKLRKNNLDKIKKI